MFKLIAIDIDGTLLKNDKTIPEENLFAIQRAHEKGIKVVLSTGRPMEGLEKYSTQLGLTGKGDYGIACSGAFIKNLGTNELIFQSKLSFQEFKYLYELSKKLKITLNAVSKDTIITPTLNLTSQLEAVLSNLPVKITDFENIDENAIINRIVYINETESFAAHLMRVLKRNNVNLFSHEGTNGNELLKFKKENLPPELLENFSVLQPSGNTFEILSKGINKGSSVDLLAKSLGIAPEEVICIGDSDNDADMIKYAGLGVAMGNALPEVKEIADYVTYSNEENGVAHVIDKFIFQKDTEKAV